MSANTSPLFITRHIRMLWMMVIDVLNYFFIKLTVNTIINSAGSVYNLGMSVHTLGPYYNIIYFPYDKNSKVMFEKAEIVASIPARWPLHPSYMHTFGGRRFFLCVWLWFCVKFSGVTENYFLIVEQPLSLSVPAMVSNKLVTSEPLAGCFRWYHEEKVRFKISFFGESYCKNSLKI